MEEEINSHEEYRSRVEGRAYNSFSRTARTKFQDGVVASLRDRVRYNELQLAKKKETVFFNLGFSEMNPILRNFQTEVEVIETCSCCLKKWKAV